MLLRRCDRCGKEVQFFFNKPYKVTFSDTIIVREYDLCKDCMNEVRDFIIKPRTEVER